ncbi:MAG: M24 family metallopeptidase [Phycisphaerales bacterium]
MPSTTTARRTAKSRPKAPKISQPAHQRFVDRLTRLRAGMAKAGLPAALITSPKDVGYLTGFLGGDSYLLLTATGAVILSDSRYDEELEPCRPFCDVVIRKKLMSDALADLLTAHRIKRLGIQPEHATLATRSAIASKASGVELVEAPGIVARLRILKDEHEIKAIKKAIALPEEALEATLKFIAARLRKGPSSEMEVAAKLEFEMKIRGSSAPGFETIVGAKANGSLPHYRPHDVKFSRNHPVLIDWGAIYNGYHGDMTRVFCWGKFPAKVREIYSIVLEAHEQSAAALAPGKSVRAVDEVARGIIRRAGYEQQFGHGLGHGMGLDGHEGPSLSHLAEDRPLEPGMVVTIEPGIYLPGIGGVRIEDDFLITEKGAVNLCTLPKDLDYATR